MMHTVCTNDTHREIFIKLHRMRPINSDNQKCLRQLCLPLIARIKNMQTNKFHITKNQLSPFKSCAIDVMRLNNNNNNLKYLIGYDLKIYILYFHWVYRLELCNCNVN